jgi:hypothetical protein
MKQMYLFESGGERGGGVRVDRVERVEKGGKGGKGGQGGQGGGVRSGSNDAHVTDTAHATATAKLRVGDGDCASGPMAAPRYAEHVREIFPGTYCLAESSSAQVM